MRDIFVDTAFYVAILSPRDRLNTLARQIVADLLALTDVRFITAEAVLVETLTRVAHVGPSARVSAADFVSRLPADARVTVVPFTSDLFAQALDLYRRRPDKTYSMTDCMSMAVCREHGITDVLTSDHDFEQEGFTILLAGRP